MQARKLLEFELQWWWLSAYCRRFGDCDLL